MKILICGSRNYENLKNIDDLLQRLIEDASPSELITIIIGDAVGVDARVRRYIDGFTMYIYKAAWRNADGSLNRRAGLQRNLEMLDERPNKVVAFWDGESPGTRMIIETALKRRINVEVIFDWTT